MLRANMEMIIYDPISWIHPQRLLLPNAFYTTRCMSIINDIILNEFQLSTTALDFSNSKELYLARHWQVLSQAAFMAICHRYRASLAYYGLFSSLDRITKQFMLCELVESKDELRGAISFDELWAKASQALMLFGLSTSAVMKQRIPLLFPKPLIENNVTVSRAEDNDLLLTMAIQYASRYRKY